MFKILRRRELQDLLRFFGQIVGMNLESAQYLASAIFGVPHRLNHVPAADAPIMRAVEAAKASVLLADGYATQRDP